LKIGRQLRRKFAPLGIATTVVVVNVLGIEFLGRKLFRHFNPINTANPSVPVLNNLGII